MNDQPIVIGPVLGRAGTLLATMPATDSTPGVNAGMTFTMLRGVEPLLAGEAEQQLVQERLEELSLGAQRIAASDPRLAAEAEAIAGAWLPVDCGPGESQPGSRA